MNNVDCLQDHKLNIIKLNRNIIMNFKQNNNNLYNLYYNMFIENLQSEYNWNHINKLLKQKLEIIGYNMIIWNKYTSPLRYNLYSINKINRKKTNQYYFNIMIDKSLDKKNRYVKRIEWVKMKLLYDNYCINNNKFRFINLPKDVLFKIIQYI